jgi:hypothetical protein
MPRQKVDKAQWETSSGLEDDFDGWVTKFEFGTDSDYNNGESVVGKMWLEGPDVSLDRPVLWSIGDGWQVQRDGTVVNTKPTVKHFNNRSNIGRMIVRLIKELKLPMENFGDPCDPDTWVGLGFHWKRETWKNAGAAKNGLPSEGEHLMPVLFLSDKYDEFKSKAASPAPVRAVAAPVARSPQASSNGAGGAIEARLKALAKAVDYTRFMSTASSWQEVYQDGDLLTRVMDEGPTGYYQTAQAG